ncbi:MAG TPA: hypothetical protein VHE14_06175 [Solirubrobacteraceae bacterium]|nr:hypothetical protein [Solirubrobacteraceae bacterium]
MDAREPDFETLLRQALRPVDPPAELAERLESTLVNLTELAADELESWELGAMRDPRNWARPVAAVVIGAGAGTGLALLRMRRRHQRDAHANNLRRLAERTLDDIGVQARKLLSDQTR